jgi:hypothetical protein
MGCGDGKEKRTGKTIDLVPNLTRNIRLKIWSERKACIPCGNYIIKLVHSKRRKETYTPTSPQLSVSDVNIECPRNAIRA